MQSRVAAFVALTITLELNACASVSPTTAGTQTDRVVEVTDNSVLVRPTASIHEDLALSTPPDSVFAALPAVDTDLGIEVKYLNPPARELGNVEFVRVHRLGGQRLTDFLARGTGLTGPAADSYRITMLLVTSVLPDGTGSRVETRFQARGVDAAQGAKAGSTVCQSLGTLEQRLHKILRQKLGQ